jgi:hypothetical protein
MRAKRNVLMCKENEMCITAPASLCKEVDFWVYQIYAITHQSENDFLDRRSIRSAVITI